MKRRARRVVIGAAALVAVIVTVLVIANWAAVRDHLEAWHFQLTTDATMLEPITDKGDLLGLILRVDTLSFHAKCIVIGNPNQKVAGEGQVSVQVMVDETLEVLVANGYRVIEQQFPRRTFVAVRTETRTAVKGDSLLGIPLSNGGH